MKKRVLFLCLASLLSLFLILPAAAAGRTVTVRIEGAEDTLYFEQITIPSVKSVSVLEVLQTIDRADNGITLSGIDVGYISAVNGEVAGRTEQGWDGFGVRLDGKRLSYDRLASSFVTVNSEIVVYYADEFGAGLLVPMMADEDLSNGILRFFAEVPREEGDYSVEPVVGATVRWYCGDAFAAYTTDQNGEIRIEKALLLSGDHRVWIDLRNEEGVPLLLRFAPDFTVNIPTAVGDSPAVYLLAGAGAVSAAAFGVLLAVTLKKKQTK